MPEELPVVWAIPRLLQVEQLVEVGFFYKGEKQDTPAVERPAILAPNDSRRESFVYVVVLEHREGKLPQVGLASDLSHDLRPHPTYLRCHEVWNGHVVALDVN